MARLTELAAGQGFRVAVFSPIHVRVYGVTTIDYWPTSGKCWAVGSPNRAEPMTPEQAIGVAKRLTESGEVESHMRSIAVE